MTDFAKSWSLSRQRLVDEVKDLNDAQLAWKIHGRCLSIGQSAVHVAGVELSFSSQLLGMELSAEQARIKSAATEAVVNGNPFPFSDEELTAGFVAAALDTSRSILEPLITEPSEEVWGKEIKSALGPMITGEGAFARLGFHAAYHQGQAYMIKTSPGFPD